MCGNGSARAAQSPDGPETERAALWNAPPSRIMGDLEHQWEGRARVGADLHVNFALATADAGDKG